MNTVTIELKDIDYKDIKEEAKEKGITIEYIMNRFYLIMNDDKKMTAIEILTEDLLNGSSSTEEVDERADGIIGYTQTLQEEAYNFIGED